MLSYDCIAELDHSGALSLSTLTTQHIHYYYYYYYYSYYYYHIGARAHSLKCSERSPNYKRSAEHCSGSQHGTAEHSLSHHTATTAD